MSTTSFVDALRRALDGKSRLDVANEAGVTTGAIGNWLSGNITSPDPHKVFAVERALRLRPGHLSGHLGFVPNEALEPSQPVGFDQWMVEHGEQLSARQRDLLVGVYEEFTGHAAAGAVPSTASINADTAEIANSTRRGIDEGLAGLPTDRPAAPREAQRPAS